MIPEHEATILFKQNYYANAHVVINQGGTSSGKTFSIVQTLFCIACQTPKLVVTIAGQDIPNLKAGVLRDALNIYSSSDLFKSWVSSYNKTDRIFEFTNGTVIEFKSYDNAQDAKSGKRDYLFVNEANGINWDVYTELALRTSKRIYIDYNPNSGFWVHDHLLGKPGVQLIISDHRHNPFAEQSIRDKVEALIHTDIELWKVYARGLTGRVTGLIFSNWIVCDELPDLAKPIAAGLDFGFTNDHTGCIMLYKQNGELWIDELLYEQGLTNPDLSVRLAAAGLSKKIEIIADSAEPKSIEELRRLGWHITGAKKGADSIVNSIDILKRYRLNITRRSVNLRKELSRYKWRVETSGKTLNEPVDLWNHLVDPLRYIALNKLKINNTKTPTSRLPYKAQSMDKSILNGMIN